MDTEQRILLLEEKFTELLNALCMIDCPCSIAERDSGHRLDCWKIEFTNVLETIHTLGEP